MGITMTENNKEEATHKITLGERIAEARKKTGIKDEHEIARMLGTTFNYICRLEEGKDGFSSTRLMEGMAQILGIPIEELIDLQNEYSEKKHLEKIVFKKISMQEISEKLGLTEEEVFILANKILTNPPKDAYYIYTESRASKNPRVNISI